MQLVSRPPLRLGLWTAGVILFGCSAHDATQLLETRSDPAETLNLALEYRAPDADAGTAGDVGGPPVDLGSAEAAAQHAGGAGECTPRGGSPAARCGDGVINQPTEECDGPLLPPYAPTGTSCSPTCVLVLTFPASSSDGSVNQPAEACADAAPAPAAAQGDACGQCARDNCAAQLGAVVTELERTKPIVDCVLGPDWQAGAAAAAASCAEGDLLTCYCGNVTGEACVNVSPATLTGPCVAEVLAGTGCESSACVAPLFLNPENATGKAMQFIQCQQDSCHDVCFNADSTRGSSTKEPHE